MNTSPLESYLLTDEAKEDEAIYLAVTDKIYRWCCKYVPSLKVFGQDKIVSVSFKGKNMIHVIVDEYAIMSTSMAASFLKTEWEKGVDNFLAEFIRIICEMQYNHLEKAALDYRISTDYIEGKSNYKAVTLRLRSPGRLTSRNLYLKWFLKNLFSRQKEVEDINTTTDPLLRQNVSTIEAISQDVAPFAGYRDEKGESAGSFEYEVEIHVFPIMKVTLSRMRYDHTTVERSVELNLNTLDYMDKWRNFFSVWRMETLRDTKQEYQETLEEYNHYEAVRKEILEG